MTFKTENVPTKRQNIAVFVAFVRIWHVCFFNEKNKFVQIK